MLTLEVNIEGKTTSELVDALREVLRLVGEGFLSGHDSNDEGEYNFSVAGEAEEEEEGEE